MPRCRWPRRIPAREIASIYISVVKERLGVACMRAWKFMRYARPTTTPWERTRFAPAYVCCVMFCVCMCTCVFAYVCGDTRIHSPTISPGVGLPSGWLANDGDKLNSAESLVDDAGESGQVSRMLVDYVFDRLELRQRARYVTTRGDSSVMTHRPFVKHKHG